MRKFESDSKRKRRRNARKHTHTHTQKRLSDHHKFSSVLVTRKIGVSATVALVIDSLYAAMSKQVVYCCTLAVLGSRLLSCQSESSCKRGTLATSRAAVAPRSLPLQFAKSRGFSRMLRFNRTLVRTGVWRGF